MSQNLAKQLSCSFAFPKSGRRRSRVRFLETLEKRSLLSSTWYVDSSFVGTSTGSQGDPYTTIQAALDTAGAGDTILVETGNGYNESDTITVPDLTIEADASRDAVPVLDGASPSVQTSAGFNVEATGVTISGFKVENFQGSPAVVVQNGASLTLGDDNIENNANVGGDGGGIWNDGTLTVTGGTIAANDAAIGGGLFVAGGAVSLTNVSVTGNSVIGADGAMGSHGNYGQPGQPGGNGGDAFGGGIYQSGGTLVLNNDAVNSNRAVGGRGGQGGSGSFNGTGHAATGAIGGTGGAGYGGGLYIAAGVLTVSSTELNDNFAVGGTGGPGGRGLRGANGTDRSTGAQTHGTNGAGTGNTGFPGTNGGNGHPGGYGGPGGQGGSGAGGGMYVAGGTVTLTNDNLGADQADGGKGGTGGTPGTGGPGGFNLRGGGGADGRSGVVHTQVTTGGAVYYTGSPGGRGGRGGKGGNGGNGGTGGVGGNGGVGGAGQGGGVFVDAGAVTVTGVTLQNDQAIGGTGGIAHSGGRGGSGARGGYGGPGGWGGNGLTGGPGGVGGAGGNGGNGGLGGNGGIGGMGGVGTGGGFYLAGGSLTLINDTVASNSASAGLGGPAPNLAAPGGTAGAGGGVGQAGFGGTGPNGRGASGINGSTYGINGSTGPGARSIGSAGTPGSAYGGGLYLAGGSITFVNSTIALNSAGGNGDGVYQTGAAVSADNSLFAENGTVDYAGNVNATNSLFQTAPTGTVTGSNNLIGVASPSLDPNGLQQNGGPTETIALLPGSPAIDAGSTSIPGINVPTTDQRGVARTGGNDIGAFQLQTNLPAIVYVNSAWTGDAPGTAVTWIDGSTHYIGQDAFSTIAAAADGVAADGTIDALSTAGNSYVLTPAIGNARLAVTLSGDPDGSIAGGDTLQLFGTAAVTIIGESGSSSIDVFNIQNTSVEFNAGDGLAGTTVDFNGDGFTRDVEAAGTTNTFNLRDAGAGGTSGVLQASAGATTFAFLGAGPLAGNIEGDGTSTLDYSSYASGVTVNLGNGTNGTATGVSGSVTGISAIVGSPFNDTLDAGSVSGVALTGGLGTNTLSGTGTGDSVVESGFSTYKLSNNKLTGTGPQFIDKLNGITVATLTGGGATGNVFTVSSWTGTGSLTAPAGSATVIATKNADFTLSNTSLSSSDGMSLNLSGISTATLTASGKGRAFTVNGWTGTGTLAGNAATVTASESGSFVLTNSLVTSGTMSLGLSGVKTANLIDTSAGGNTFTVSDWTRSGSLTGTADTVVASKNDNITLTNASLSSNDHMALTLTGITAAILTVSSTSGDPTYIIDASAFSGTTTLTVAGTANAILYGSTGGDSTLTATGSGNDIVIGNGPRDVITDAGSGKNILIGAGGENLVTGNGNDILLSGTTIYDSDTSANIKALDAILAEWTSNDSYATRISKIMRGVGPDQLDAFNASTITQDANLNALLDGSNSTENNWFLAFPFDRVVKQSNEIETIL